MEKTKAELQVEIAELQAKLAEQQHLAAAIEAKDKEIFTHVQALKRIRQENESLVEQVKKGYAITISTLEKEKQELQSQVDQLSKAPKDLEKTEKDVKILVDENKRLVNTINQYITVFRNTLKGLQGNLDNAIELEALINPVKK